MEHDDVISFQVDPLFYVNIESYYQLNSKD